MTIALRSEKNDCSVPPVLMLIYSNQNFRHSLKKSNKIRKKITYCLIVIELGGHRSINFVYIIIVDLRSKRKAKKNRKTPDGVYHPNRSLRYSI